MTRLINAFLLLSLTVILAGCRKTQLHQPVFPLTQEAVVAALEQSGLSGVVAVPEDYPVEEGQTVYTVSGSETEETAMAVTISSALTEGERFLQVIFTSPHIPEQPSFAWESWKQPMDFAALLYGGFSDNEEFYRTFSGMEMPENTGESSHMAENYEWEVQLSAGYCRVRYYRVSAVTDSSSLGKLTKEAPPRFVVTICESKSLYDKIERERENERQRWETQVK